MPSKCYTDADAKALPAPVFECDSSEKALDACDVTTESACDAKAACTWCKSAAVGSACHTLADAKGLPPAVFTCDKKDAFLAELAFLADM